MTNASRVGQAVRDRDPLWYAPLFMIAPARSYTSVIAAMLGQHPDLYAFPELMLFRDDQVAGLLAATPRVKGPPYERTLVRPPPCLGPSRRRGGSLPRAWPGHPRGWRPDARGGRTTFSTTCSPR